MGKSSNRVRRRTGSGENSLWGEARNEIQSVCGAEAGPSLVRVPIESGDRMMTIAGYMLPCASQSYDDAGGPGVRK